MTKAEHDDADSPSPARAKLGKAIAAKLARNPMVTPIDNPGMEIFARRNFATAQECAALRALVDAGAQPSPLFSGSANADYRTSYTCYLDPQDDLVGQIDGRIVAMMGIAPQYGETIQGQRYEQGQEYRLHCDTFPTDAHYWPRMHEQGGQRCWTAMLYLSGVAEGGETQFPRCQFRVPPREGMLLIWNNLCKDGSPNENSIHAGLPVLNGTKYVLTKWFRERHWFG